VSRDVSLYLDDMIEACRRVGQYTDGLGRAQLVSGTMAHDAVLRNLEVLGEAAKNVPNDVRGLDVEIPWRRIIGLRDSPGARLFRDRRRHRVERCRRGAPMLVAATGRPARTALTCEQRG
jgi:uncharacterized protein with HEPN domain